MSVSAGWEYIRVKWQAQMVGQDHGNLLPINLKHSADKHHTSIGVINLITTVTPQQPAFSNSFLKITLLF